MACSSSKVGYLNDLRGDLITCLIKRPFRERISEEKIAIAHMGRPVPFLDLFLKAGKRGEHDKSNTYYMLDYNSWWYEHYQWLTGSKDSQKLYCWPCLLFSKGSKEKNIWVEGGQFNLNSLQAAAETHSTSKIHVENMRLCAELKDKADQVALASNCIKAIPWETQNALTHKQAAINVNLLQRLIDVAMLVYKLDMTVEYIATDWFSGDKFKRFFDFVTAGDKDLKKHREDLGDAFTKILRTYLDDFLDCLQNEIQYFGFLDIIQCKPQPLCSLQLDSVRDIDADMDLLFSIMLRYVDNYGIVQQRFFGLVSNDTRSAYRIGQNVDEAMVRYRHNVIAQSYDGACVLVDELATLRKKIQCTAPSAILTPSIDHPLNEVLLQGVNCVKGARVFAAIIQDLVVDPKPLTTLSQLRQTDNIDRKWKVNAKLLTYLLKERESFISAFEERSTDVCIPLQMSLKIAHLINNLKDFEFIFLLYVFNDIFQITEEVSDVVVTHLSDVNVCFTTVKRAIIKLKLLKSEGKAQEYIKDAKSCVPTGTGKVNPTSFVQRFDLIIDNIVVNIESRFGHVKQFEFLQLVDSKKFPSYDEAFPENALISLNNLYGKHFEIKRLKKELKCFIYSNQRFRSLSAEGVIKLIRDMGLRDAIPQAYKLFCLAATLPITTVEGGSCLGQVHAYINECKKHSVDMYENHRALPSMGMNTVMMKHAQVVIEKPLVSFLASQEWFQDSLIDQHVKGKKEYQHGFLPES